MLCLCAAETSQPVYLAPQTISVSQFFRFCTEFNVIPKFFSRTQALAVLDLVHRFNRRPSMLYCEFTEVLLRLALIIPVVNSGVSHAQRVVALMEFLGIPRMPLAELSRRLAASNVKARAESANESNSKKDTHKKKENVLVADPVSALLTGQLDLTHNQRIFRGYYTMFKVIFQKFAPSRAGALETIAKDTPVLSPNNQLCLNNHSPFNICRCSTWTSWCRYFLISPSCLGC
jgi:hypothetical protein